ncbi:MAG: zinc metalloprotease HtpX [Fusobacteriaceae bacterium]|nr:zinc metalloprotease HtpX [Fusobacteriaceae bacterium]
MNGMKTFVLMMVMTFIFLILGNALGGSQGVIIAFIFALVTNFISYWFSDKIVLSMYRAVPLTEGTSDGRRVFGIVRELVREADLPMPTLYKIGEAQPNAFATGRNPEHAAVVVTEGILRVMDDNELSGVLAHELGHVHNRDILISSVAAVMASAISFLSTMARWGAITGGRSRRRNNNGIILLVLAIFAPIAAMLVRLAISRAREYKADDFSAKITKNPMFLANALTNLESQTQRIPMDANPATENMFIVSPLSGSSFATLFSTHPPIKERINRLIQMDRTEL